MKPISMFAFAVAASLVAVSAPVVAGVAATVNFSPTTVNLPNGGSPPGGVSGAGTVGVTLSGGAGPAAYACSVPAGFQLTNAAQSNLPANSDPADIGVTCTLGAVARSGMSTCTQAGNPDVVLTLNCPASVPIAPIITPTPANGTPLSCNGDPFSTQTAQIAITNTTNFTLVGLSCSTTGPAFSIRQGPSATLAASASTTAIVSCVVPPLGAPAATGTLNCTAQNGGGALSFPLSSLGQVVAAPSRPAAIPSLAMWSTIALAVLLAAFGAITRRR